MASILSKVFLQIVFLTEEDIQDKARSLQIDIHMMTNIYSGKFSIQAKKTILFFEVFRAIAF